MLKDVPLAVALAGAAALVGGCASSAATPDQSAEARVEKHVAAPAANNAMAAQAVPGPAAVIDQFERNRGVHPGYRINHAKGMCVSGYFQSNGQLAAASTAEVFQPGLRTPVIGRFSIPGGNPEASDAATPVRGLALAFTQPNGEQWRMDMLNAPVFSAPTPAVFFQGLQADQPDPATGKPNPLKKAAAAKANPSAAAFMQWARSTRPSASFATQSYNVLTAYEFVNAQGQMQPVRWRFASNNPGTGTDQGPGPNGLATDLAARLAKGPLTWQLEVAFAEPGDPVADATRAWPTDRPVIDGGTLVLTSAAPGQTGACRDVVFDPLMLPRGIQPSADPLLRFRSSAYQEDFSRRTQAEARDK